MKKIIISIIISLSFFMGSAYALTENDSLKNVDSVKEEGKISTEKIIGILVILGGVGIFIKSIQRASKL